MGKLDELTPDLYLKYKRSELTDKEIGRMFDCTRVTMYKWKKDNGLGDVDLQSWDTWDKYFPDKVEKIKKRFLELYNQSWKHIAIAEEMGMSKMTLTRFKERYFPELFKKTEMRLTQEQRQTAKDNGISLNAVHLRVRRQGMTIEEAIRTPLKTGWRGDPEKQRIGKKFASEVEVAERNAIEYPFTPKEIRRAANKGITRAILTSRYRKGWSKTRALTQPPRTRKGNKK